MRNPNRRSVAIGYILAVLVIALGVATPASAQFGGLKKKLKGEAATKAVDKAIPDAAAPSETATAPGGDNSTIVLTPETVDNLLAGIRAGKGERVKAEGEDTPYGRYKRAVAAYEVAKPKCDAAQQTWPTRLAANEKLMKRNEAIMNKMMAAMEKQDQKTQQIYADSMLGMVDASCLVKQPSQPSDLYDQQRAVDERAEQASLKASGFSGGREWGQVVDRVIPILQDAEVPGGASAAEKSAVNAKAAELKTALGLRAAQEERVAKQAPARADTVVAQPAPQPTVTVPPAAAAMNACMVQNLQTHDAEVRALGDRGDAARKAGNNAAMMAIADTIRQIQMAGCGGQR